MRRRRKPVRRQFNLRKLSRYIREQLPVVLRRLDILEIDSRRADNAQIYFMAAMVAAIILIQVGLHYRAPIDDFNVALFTYGK